jgi:hypothetical protein
LHFFACRSSAVRFSVALLPGLVFSSMKTNVKAKTCCTVLVLVLRLFPAKTRSSKVQSMPPRKRSKSAAPRRQNKGTAPPAAFSSPGPRPEGNFYLYQWTDKKTGIQHSQWIPAQSTTSKLQAQSSPRQATAGTPMPAKARSKPSPRQATAVFGHPLNDRLYRDKTGKNAVPSAKSKLHSNERQSGCRFWGIAVAVGIFGCLGMVLLLLRRWAFSSWAKLELHFPPARW